jgi:1-acyl-sn-glycerol-3-phosphate acyltransferase
MQATDLAGGARRNGDAARPGGSADRPEEPRTSPGGRLPRVLRDLGERAQRRLPRPTLDERDPDWIREQLPLLWLISSLWFRAEVRGLGNVPDEGPVLLVGNHSGGNVTPDTAVFTLAFNTYFGVERQFHQLVDGRISATPGLRWLRRFGTVAASPENARRALRAGAVVLVYPGGEREAHRPSWRQGRVELGGRTDFIRLALEENVRIVPVVAIGAQETALFLSRGEALARALRLDRMLGLRALPVSLALPWALNVGDLLGHLPLPSKITIETLPAIDVREEFGEDPEAGEIYDHLTAIMQDTLDALSAERRLPIVG